MSDSSLHLNIQMSEPTRKAFQKHMERFSQAISWQCLGYFSKEYLQRTGVSKIVWPSIRHFQKHEEAILQIRKIINCSEKEVLAYLDIFHFWRSGDVIRYAQIHGDFPLIKNHEYSCCLNCHKRRWRYVGERRGPCSYCGLYDPNIDPRFSVELGERVTFEPRDTDIEI